MPVIRQETVNRSLFNPGKLIVAAVIVIVALILIFSSYFTINATERGVLLFNGAIHGIEQPGLHFKLPFFESVTAIPISTRLIRLNNMESYSYDQQPAHVRISVTYHLDPTKIANIYTQYQSADNIELRLLAPAIQKQFKNVFGTYTAQSAIQDRVKLNSDFEKALLSSIDGLIVIEGVQIEDITFSKEYIASIESRMTAQIEVEKYQQNLAREKVQAEIALTQAQGRANAAVAAAKAAATATELRGNAEAAAIKARGDALRANPGLVALEAVEKWNGQLPRQMVPGSAVPFLSLNDDTGVTPRK